ncbi:uncharacterized protein LOC125231666 [Leguminivora glycinivorella]|uniref:uncharacterized protein LOC125231666 n=1 Tax=Leguminivora glycinivorella TaxID=1035111 RepID=UPI00200BC618|nr:uncharacterized protein LOC125231666 [Leguminivora glycinivorella]XP_047993128.1 uncharacterized protein LOC125231666 [Leguminivora glycinivorella]
MALSSLLSKLGYSFRYSPLGGAGKLISFLHEDILEVQNISVAVPNTCSNDTARLIYCSFRGIFFIYVHQFNYNILCCNDKVGHFMVYIKIRNSFKCSQH